MSFSGHSDPDLGDLSHVVYSDESLENSLRRVADAALRTIKRCDAASVSMAEDGRVTTWVSTHPEAERVDRHQYQVDEGPCLDAIRTGEANFLDSLESDQRWPKFTQRASAEGMVSTYSIPLKVGEETVGALNLYSRTKPFAYPDVQAAEALADQAAVTLSNAHAFEQARDRIVELEEALDSQQDGDDTGDPSPEVDSRR